MKISLNEIVSMLSERVGQPFNKSLQEELKVVINYKTSSFFKRLLEQNPGQRRFFLKDFSAQLTKVDKADCPVNIGCDVLRTVYEVPTPLRNNLNIFDFVGTVNKMTGFTYSSPDQLPFLKHSKYTADLPKYFYIDKYIYIYNNLDLEWINIRGIFPDQRQLTNFLCNGAACYTDDDQFDMPEDMLNDVIRDILSIELRNMFPEQGEVKLDEQNNQA